MPLEPWRLAGKLSLAIALLFAMVGVVGWLFHDPLVIAGNAIVDIGGIAGIALVVVLLDPLPGLGFIPGLMVGTAAQVHGGALYFVTIAASLVSSILGWVIGKYAGNLAFVRWTLGATGAMTLVGRWGARAVALASVTPLPYGLATVAAGASGMPLRLLMFAATARWLKIGLSLLAVRAGWSVSGG